MCYRRVDLGEGHDRPAAEGGHVQHPRALGHDVARGRRAATARGDRHERQIAFVLPRRTFTPRNPVDHINCTSG